MERIVQQEVFENYRLGLVPIKAANVSPRPASCRPLYAAREILSTAFSPHGVLARAKGTTGN
jgi:hypothetical protein